MADGPADLEHQLPKDIITPHEAIRKLIDAHDNHCVEGLRGSEYSNPQRVLAALDHGPDIELEETYYSEDSSPKLGNLAIGSLTRAFLTVRPGQEVHEPTEYEKMDYNFGQQALTKDECITLIGSSFVEEAGASIAASHETYKQGVIQREILPGIILNILVIDENNPYGDKSGLVPNFKVTTSFATVPLVAEAPLTGRGLLEGALEKYHQDFTQRYEPAINGQSPSGEQLFEAESLEVTVAQIVQSIIEINEARGVKPRPPAEDALDVIRDPDYLTREDKLYLLARMESELVKAEGNFPISKGSDLNTQTRVVAEIYSDFIQRQTELARRAYEQKVQALRSGESLPPLSEEVRDEIVAHNVALLEHVFILETPYWELDDETRKETNAIRRGERRLVKGGRIVVPAGDYILGDYSRFNTILVTRGEKTERTFVIELLQNPSTPTLSEIGEDLTGEEGPEEKNRRVLPERIIPERPELMGPREQWGESVHAPSAEGDLTILKAIQAFNRKHSRAS